jgi:hypothetical protein
MLVKIVKKEKATTLIAKTASKIKGNKIALCNLSSSKNNWIKEPDDENYNNLSYNSEDNEQIVEIN